MIPPLSYHSAESDVAPEIPARLGRYELIGQLATGGMAEIHLARLAGEAGFEKTVVVKRLLPELVASKAFVAMFLDEGKLVARLDHPNVCEVHELGRDGAEYFLVMPYLDGVPVHDFIARPRDPDRIAPPLLPSLTSGGPPRIVREPDRGCQRAATGASRGGLVVASQSP